MTIFGKRNVDYGRVTDATLEEIRQTANACIAENARRYTEAQQLHAQLLQSAEIIYGTGAELRYIREHKVPTPPDLQHSYKLFVEKVNNARRKSAQQAQRKQAEAEERRRRSESAQKAAATRARNRELAAQWDTERADIICSD